MKILAVLAAMMLTCYACGHLIACAVSPRQRRSWIATNIGYAYLLVAFFPLYMISRSAVVATYATLILPVVLAGARFVWSRIKPDREPDRSGGSDESSLATRRADLINPLLAGGVVCLFAIWPYLLCGWGNYWHSGNYDMEDGLNGRDAYLEGKIFDPGTDRRPARTLPLYGYSKRAASERVVTVNIYKEGYAGDFFRFQYSSLAFWSVLFNEHYNLDIFLEQSLANLLMMSIGLYCLARRFFRMSPAAAWCAAAMAPLSAFYLATYSAGHEGSLIYGSLVPALLCVTLVKDIPGRIAWLYAGLIVLAIGFAYPHPLAVIAPPVVAYRLWEVKRVRQFASRLWGAISANKLRLAAALAVAALCMVVGGVALWHVSEGNRIHQAETYRAWGYTHTWIIVPVFLGLLPLQVAQGLGHSAYQVLIELSIVIAIGLAVLYYRYAARRHGFFALFGVCWVGSYLVFRFFIVDSYYIFKFLYTNQFVLVMGLVAAFVAVRSVLVRTLCAALVVLNLVGDGRLGVELYRNSYNHDRSILAELYRIDAGTLSRTMVELWFGEATQVRQGLIAHGTPTTIDPRAAKYVVVRSDHEADIADEQFTEALTRPGGKIAVMKVPEKNYLLVRSYPGPEVPVNEPILRGHVFRWVGNEALANLRIHVLRPDPAAANAKRYLRVCLQAGPSALGVVPVTFSEQTGVLSRVDVDGLDCTWLPSKQVLSSPPMVVHSDAPGLSILPYDDRILLYRIFAVGWVDETYDEVAMSLFNSADDITATERPAGGSSSPAPVKVLLGQGWDSPEGSGAGRFRWAGGHSEIVMENGGAADTATVEIDIESGPSHGPKPFRLMLDNQRGEEVFRSRVIRSREKLEVPLACKSGPRCVFVLRTDGERLHLSGDFRNLDHRVFSIRVIR